VRRSDGVVTTTYSAIAATPTSARSAIAPRVSSVTVVILARTSELWGLEAPGLNGPEPGTQSLTSYERPKSLPPPGVEPVLPVPLPNELLPLVPLPKELPLVPLL